MDIVLIEITNIFDDMIRTFIAEFTINEFYIYSILWN